MNKIFDYIENPDKRRVSPKPLKIDLKRVFLVLICMWLLALVVSLVLAILGIIIYIAFYVCVVGVLVGVILLLWERANRAKYYK
jgi:Flp pilus assembly protein TadB